MSLLTVPGVVVPAGSPRMVPRWETGVGIQPDDCDVPLTWDEAGSDEDFPYWWDCPGQGGDTPQNLFETVAAQGDGYKNISAPEATEVFDALTLWAGYTCRAGSAELTAEGESRALAKLDALTPTAIEHELWSGQIAGLADFPNPSFIDAGLATLVQGGTPLGFVTALAELEQAIADSAPLTSPAIIHAQPRVVTAWKAMDLVEVVPAGTHLVTATGTIVVPERGATGVGVVGGTTYTPTYSYSFAYATGMIHVWLGNAQVSSNVSIAVEQAPVVAALISRGPNYPGADRELNNLEIRAERDYVLAWNPCGLLGVRVALCDVYCSGGS